MGKKIIKFGAEWCQPCHILDKTLDEINKERPIEIEKVDAEYPNWRDANLIETCHDFYLCIPFSSNLG